MARRPVRWVRSVRVIRKNYLEERVLWTCEWTERASDLAAAGALHCWGAQTGPVGGSPAHRCTGNCPRDVTSTLWGQTGVGAEDHRHRLTLGESTELSPAGGRLLPRRNVR